MTLYGGGREEIRKERKTPVIRPICACVIIISVVIRHETVGEWCCMI